MGRRSTVLVRALAGTGAALLLCKLRSGAVTEDFVGAPTARGANRVAMRGFKEDFEAWKGTLTEDEAKVMQRQALNEYNKKYRKSDEFKVDLPKDKQAKFTEIVQKFLENESDDYQKQLRAKKMSIDDRPKKEFQMGLTHSITEIDRHADRLYHMALIKEVEAEAKGKVLPPSSPRKEMFKIENSAETNPGLVEAVDAINKQFPDSPAIKVPPVGEDLVFWFPVKIHQQIEKMMTPKAGKKGSDVLSKLKYLHEKFEKDDPKRQTISNRFANDALRLAEGWAKQNKEVTEHALYMRDWFRSSDVKPGTTKADVMKEILAGWSKHFPDKPVPEIDAETMAEFANRPLILEGPIKGKTDYRNPWGTADKLWRSEAVDRFGMKVTLGLFETIDEAKSAFASWNEAYNKARAEVQEEMEQWGRKENARIDEEPDIIERVKQLEQEAQAA